MPGEEMIPAQMLYPQVPYPHDRFYGFLGIVCRPEPLAFVKDSQLCKAVSQLELDKVEVVEPESPRGERAVKCPGCGADVPVDLLYCYYCGRDLKYEPSLTYSDIPAGAVVECPKCGTKNVRTERICTKCDFDLTDAKKALAQGIVAEPQRYTAKCLNCGLDNPVVAKYCGSCGWSIGPQPVPGPSIDQRAAAGYVALWIAAFCYILSFFIPPIGAVLGVVFYTNAPHPWSEYRRVGELCLILAVIGAILWTLLTVILVIAATL